tara:strand:+ start:187 stop:501 length:315 start_codon:yes stop_codon:yes gene_type:complete
MSNLEEFSKSIAKYYPYFFLPLILIYLFFNIFDGNNGLLSHQRLDMETVALKKNIDSIKRSNILYETKISSINKLNVESDLVDEQIRKILGYGKMNEFVIFFDN